MKFLKVLFTITLAFPLIANAAEAKKRKAKTSVKKTSIKTSKAKVTSIKTKPKSKVVIQKVGSVKGGKTRKPKTLSTGQIVLEGLLAKQKVLFQEIGEIIASEVVKVAEYQFLINREQMVNNDVAYLKQYQKLHPGVSLEAVEKIYKKNAPSLENIVDAAIKKQFASLVKKYEASYNTEVYSQLAQ